MAMVEMSEWRAGMRVCGHWVIIRVRKSKRGKLVFGRGRVRRVARFIRRGRPGCCVVGIFHCHR